MTTRIIVNGAFGKMGKLSADTIEQHPDFELVACLGKRDNLADAIVSHRADIVIDFTHASAVYENALCIIEQGAHPIIGASGLSTEEVATLQSKCQQQALSGIIAPNFSIGAILMMRLAAEAAKYFPDAEIIEAHHQQKLDAPSGTAVKTAQLIDQQRRARPSQLALKEIYPGARGALCEAVPVHAIRLPGYIASQQVIFGNKGENLTISHNSINRECFMPGLILACQKVTQIDGLVYGLENLLD